mmetsp:Transcript_329/g.745  ORF Transcript_329/g.745 Transcript_329/m.745 type:complete len:267 (+) Transcript_329:78-878(+)
MARFSSAMVALSSSLEASADDDGETELVLPLGVAAQPSRASQMRPETHKRPSDLSLDELALKPAAPPEGVVPACDDDMELPTTQLPAEVVVKLTYSRGHFSLCCELDLKTVACKLRNAEYNPRKSQSQVSLRLLRPHTHATLWASGAVTCWVKGDEPELRQASRRVARMIQKCGYEARCEKFRMIGQSVTADLCFPVRLEALAQKWQRHVLYEPEVQASAFFYLQHPHCKVAVASSGKVSILNAGSYEEAKEAIRRTYHVFREFSR